MSQVVDNNVMAKKVEIKKEDDAIQIGETKTVDVGERTGDGEKMDAGGATTVEEPSSPIKEIEKVAEKPLQEPIVETPKIQLPENIEKLVDFMKEISCLFLVFKVFLPQRGLWMLLVLLVITSMYFSNLLKV